MEVKVTKIGLSKEEVWLMGENRTVRIVLTFLGKRKTEVMISDSTAAYTEEEVWNLPMGEVKKILVEFYKDFLEEKGSEQKKLKQERGDTRLIDVLRQLEKEEQRVRGIYEVVKSRADEVYEGDLVVETEDEVLIFGKKLWNEPFFGTWADSSSNEADILVEPIKTLKEKSDLIREFLEYLRKVGVSEKEIEIYFLEEDEDKAKEILGDVYDFIDERIEEFFGAEEVCLGIFYDIQDYLLESKEKKGKKETNVRKNLKKL